MNSVRLKGIHLAMRTGMLAAETAFEAVRTGDTSDGDAEGLRRSRPARARSARSSTRCATSTRRSATDRSPARCSPGCRSSPAAGGSRIRCRRTAAGRGCRSCAEYYKDARPDPESTVNPVKIDRQLTFDRLTNVHYSGTRHPEDQPSHLVVHDASVCATRCREEFGNPCIRFCPANVYEMVDAGGGGRRSCRSTRRTACTARRATSWTPTRSSTGSRPKAAADRSTKACRIGIGSGNLVICRQSRSDVRAASQGRADLGDGHSSHSRARRRPIAGGSTASRHYESIVASGQAADLRVLARAHPAGHALLEEPRHRRHHQPELRRRVDCRHHPALRLRHGARLDVARRRARAGAAAARPGGRAGRRRSPSTARAARRGSRSPARCSWPARPATRSCRFTSKSSSLLDDEQLGPHAGPEAVQPRRASPSASRCTSPTPLKRDDRSQARLELERRLGAAGGDGETGDQELRRLRTQLTTEIRNSHVADLLATLPGTHHTAGSSRSVRNGPRCSTQVAAAWRDHAAGASSSRGRRRARSCCACTTPAHVDAIEATRGRAVMLDADTFTSPESYEIALLAAGAAVQAAEHALDDRRDRVRARASAGPPRRARQGDGLLPLQQRRRRGGRGDRARPVARRGRRHRRPSRQRHAVDVLRRPARALRLDAPVSVLSRHRRRRARPAPATGKGFTFNIPLAAGATDADYAAAYDAMAARLDELRARAAARLRRLRRARGRSARVDARDDGGYAAIVRPRRRGRARSAVRSRSSPRAATTSTRCARASSDLDAAACAEAAQLRAVPK